MTRHVNEILRKYIKLSVKGPHSSGVIRINIK